MLSKSSLPMNFSNLEYEDTDLTLFTIQSLTLSEDANMVTMALKLKRKVVMELLTTFLPTILLLTITYTTIFFNKDLFGDSLAVNLTIMLVMTTIFTSKIEELPPTSDTKMIDLWLIFCLLVPFTEVVLRTAIEVLAECGCEKCEELKKRNLSKVVEEEKKDSGKKKTPPGQPAPQIWPGRPTRVAPSPEQVSKMF